MLPKLPQGMIAELFDSKLANTSRNQQQGALRQLGPFFWTRDKPTTHRYPFVAATYQLQRFMFRTTAAR
eukprot:m.462328 g.462328  ORF g.462328 m.462328 type:complete len:69 (-) comp20349_c0_seq18:555-761(-)